MDIKYIKDNEGNNFFPVVNEKGVVDDNGTTLESKLQSKQDAISDIDTIRSKANTAIQSITVGTTTTGEAGSSANVINTGTATAPVLNFTIPQGAQGVKGDTVIMGSEATYTLYNTNGDAVDGAMTQKAVTDVLYDVVYEGLDDKTIDISTYTKVNAWIGANGNWSTTSGQQTAIIPTENYTKVSITSNSSNGAYLLFCKIYPTISSGTSYSSSLCEGETGRRVQDANTTVVYNIPSDCTYIAVGCTSAASAVGIYIPSNFTFLAEGQTIIVSSVNRIERLEDAVLYPVLSDYSTVDVTDGESVTSWLNSSGEWKILSGQLSYIVDVEQYSSMRITANADFGTYFLLCKTHPNVTSSNTSYIQYACDGEDGRRVQSANTTETYNLPSDCKYIVFGAQSTSAQTNAYLPSLVEFAYATNTMLSKIDDLYADIEELSSAKTIKILAIGNSFSRDALSYVPMFLKSLNINAVIGILYHSSCSLQMHWENRESTTYYTFDYFNWNNGQWVQSSSKGLDYGLACEDWDIVTLQQNSSNSIDYSTYQPYLNNLVGYIDSKVHNVKLGWLLTHAWATGYSSLSTEGITSDEMAALIRACSKRVMMETAIDMVIPYGTAIQLARGDSNINQIGNAGNFSYEGVHLQEGLGCQIAAYTSTISLANIIDGRLGINGNETLVNSSFLSTYNIPEQHGSAAGSTAENIILGQRYASIAVKNPYQEAG